MGPMEDAEDGGRTAGRLPSPVFALETVPRA